MLSCGIDIVSNARVEKLYRRYGERFTKKLFPEGIDYCLKRRKGELFGCIAARIALKEATIKAFSQLGIDLKLSDIAVTGGGKGLRLRVKGYSFRLVFSISHERDYSVAVVNVESGEETPAEIRCGS